MIIIVLYRLAILSKNNIIENTQQEIAKLCAISRSLVRKVFEEGVAEGFFSYTNDKKIHTESKFLHLVQEYMSYYFSYAAYCSNITLRYTPETDTLSL